MRIRRCALVFSLVLVCAWLSPAAKGQSQRQHESSYRKAAERHLGRPVAGSARAARGIRYAQHLSDTSSPTRGIGAARQWIFDELRRSSPRLHVSFDTHVLAPQMQLTGQAEIRNVLAVLPGRSARRIYISAHYDSLNSGRQTLDNYSRAATERAPPDLRLDLKFDHNVDSTWCQRQRQWNGSHDGAGSRVRGKQSRLRRHLVFALWAGEEQALLGAHAHAQGARLQKIPIEAVLNNDIVGNVQGLDGKTDSRTVHVYSAGPRRLAVARAGPPFRADWRRVPASYRARLIGARIASVVAAITWCSARKASRQ